MMRVRTIEMDYEYQMGIAIRQLLESLEMNLSEVNPDDLEQILWDNREEFGVIVVEKMGEWTSSDDWHNIANR